MYTGGGTSSRPRVSRKTLDRKHEPPVDAGVRKEEDRPHGWVPVDPADVRKVVLEEPPGGLPLDDPKVQMARAKLFGEWEMNWMAYNYAHDITLPGSSGAPVAFLMYPQAETGGGRKDSLDPDHFRYTITSREIPV